MAATPPRNPPFGEWKTPKRAEIQALKRQFGMSIRQISAITDVPFNSVARILRFNGPRRSRLTRTRRLKIITIRCLRRLICKLQLGWYTRRMSLLVLARTCSIRGSRRTIQRALQKAGYYRCVACRRLFINIK